MQKVNVDVHIWNELRSSDRFGFNIYNAHVSNIMPKAFCDIISAILADLQHSTLDIRLYLLMNRTT